MSGQDNQFTLQIPVVNSNRTVAMEFCWIPPGWFRIGERGTSSPEEPPTWVRIETGFWMGKYPVTLAQYRAFYGVGVPEEEMLLPLLEFSWKRAVEYLNELNRSCHDELKQGNLKARLPTEVEWEYACRAGTDTEYVFGDGIGALRERQLWNGIEQSHEMVCFNENSGYKSRRVDLSLANPFGLHEVHGNDWEWCRDRYDSKAYRRFRSGLTAEEAWALSESFGDDGDRSGFGEVRVTRGGSDNQDAEQCRAAYRAGNRAVYTNRRYRGACLRACLASSPTSQAESRGESAEVRRQAEAQKDNRRDGATIQIATAQSARYALSELRLPEASLLHESPASPEVLETSDGINWSSELGSIDAKEVWRASDRLTKLVIGELPTKEKKARPISVELPADFLDMLKRHPPEPPPKEKARPISVALPADLADLFPNLTHLYLWQIDSLKTLPRLPANLQVIDLRGCRNLESWGEQTQCDSWGASLEELFLDDTRLSGSCWSRDVQFPRLIEFSICGCTQWPDLSLNHLLRASPRLRYLDAGDCPQIEQLLTLPSPLRVLKLNACPRLRLLPFEFPARLRRLELQGSTMKRLPKVHSRLDYVDLREMKSLTAFPDFEVVASNGMPSQSVAQRNLADNAPMDGGLQRDFQNRLEWPNEDWLVQPQTWRPRTLYLHGTGIACDIYLKGETADTNVSDRVFAYLSEKPFVPDREVKVILLGNGRSGKSSFANALVNKKFSKDEATTHGIKLWTIEDFPVPSSGDPTDVDKAVTARLNIWDFAGQDLYHGTHRLFLQEKAVYIVCHSNPDYPGADEETDAFEKVAAETEKKITGIGDRPRKPVYWQQMIRSLLGSGQSIEQPEILFLHTKSDRWDEKEPSDPLPDGYSWIPFSAPGYVVAMQLKAMADQEVSLEKAILDQVEMEPGIRDQLNHCSSIEGWIDQQLDSMNYITNWIGERARQLLGPETSHELPSSAMMVKEEIRHWIRENGKAYEAHERNRFEEKPHQRWSKAVHSLQYRSPHPKIARKDFDALVAKHCGRWYSSRPELLLNWFHQSGFLYFDPENLPDDVLIDQRWAIHGIYTLFDRSGSPNLMDEIRRNGGLVPIAELKKRWDQQSDAYSPEDQKLFLDFMISCGMAYVVLTEEESILNQKIIAFPSLFPERELFWKEPSGRQVLDERLAFEIPDCSESEVRTMLARLGRRWSRRMEAYRWGCCHISPTVERSEFRMEWLEKSEQSDRYVFPLYISFQGQEDKATEMFVHETLFEVLQQSRGLSQEQFLQIWPKLERSDGPEMARSEGVERRQQVGIAIGISYAGPNRTRKLPSRILEDEDFWLGEIPRSLSLKIREGISPRRRTAAGEWMPGVVAVYFYDADDRAETPPAMVANLTKSDLFLAFISRKYLHSPYCMVEIFEVFRNHNRKLPNGKVFIVDLMSIPNGGAQPMNYRRRQFQVADWMEYWKKKWKTWFKVADYFATKRLANNSLATGGGGLNAQSTGNFLLGRNTSYELDRLRTNHLEGKHSAYATWKDAIRSDEPNPILADLGKQIRDNSTGSQVVIPVGVFDVKDPQARAEINGQVAKLFNEVRRLIERQMSESSE